MDVMEPSPGQLWEHVVDRIDVVQKPFVRLSPEPPAGLCVVVMAESLGSWVMRRLSDGRTFYMHPSARRRGEWVYRGFDVDDFLERAFWKFDAFHKAHCRSADPKLQGPMTERDAFKRAVRELIVELARSAHGQQCVD
jgi:hypothetical protein